METGTQGRSIIYAPPPVIFVLPFAAGVLLHWLLPVQMLPHWGRVVLGIACTVPAVVLLTTARMAFRQARTSMLPNARARTLVVNGPFRHTRNPLYLGLLLLYAGISVGTGDLWSLLFMPLVILWLHYGAILPEERYLEQQFGEEYLRYKVTVRRWL